MQSATQQLITSVSPLGVAFLLTMAVLLLLLPRRFATFPVIALTCFMPMGERFVIADMNFTMIRMLLLFGWLRVLVKGEFANLRWNSADKILVAWVIIRTINYTLVYGGSAALINRLGYAYDIFGSYFMLRSLVRDPEDLYRSIRFLAVLILPLVGFMVSEKFTGINSFAILGGAPFSEVREGVIRAQGPFAHSILAGSFGAGVFPLFLGMLSYKKGGYVLPLLATVASLGIVAVSGSSGPVMAAAGAALALMLWPLRSRMRLIRWGVLLSLFGLQFVMNSPVWYIAGRLTVFSSSTGWFRGFLIDQTVRHLDEWWLIGSSAAPSWHYYLADVTNQYLAEGLGGGLVAMCLFIALIWRSFRSIGKTIDSPDTPSRLKWLSWTMGATLFAHAVSFMSVSYFDQTLIVFYFLLAAISAVAFVAVPVASAEDSLPSPSAAYYAASH